MKTLIRILMAVLTFGSFLPSVTAQPYMRLDASFYSQALDQVRKVDIYLPADYYVNPSQQYAAIYSLHGATGNQNSNASEAMLYYTLHSQNTSIISPAALYICPDGSAEPYLGGCYINSELYGNHEDYIIQDLIGFIEANFRVVPHKNFRFITGMSMGGFGSARLSVYYPDMFRGCMPNVGFLSLLRLEIEDDGIGREKAMEILKKSGKHHQSLSTNITRERLAALNRKSRNKISLKIDDLADDAGNPAGTRVTVDIPY